MAQRVAPRQPQPAASVSTVIPGGDRRASLEALRDRLAEETNDVTWSKHKAECRCSCGMGDGRVLVALVKELRAVMAELDAMPADKGASKLDRIAAGVADELAVARGRRRSSRVTGSASS